MMGPNGNPNNFKPDFKSDFKPTLLMNMDNDANQGVRGSGSNPAAGSSNNQVAGGSSEKPYKRIDIRSLLNSNPSSRSGSPVNVDIPGNYNNQVAGSSNPGNPDVTGSPSDLNRSFNIDPQLTLADVDGAYSKIMKRLWNPLIPTWLNGPLYDGRNLFASTNNPETNLTYREKSAIIKALNDGERMINPNPPLVYCYVDEVDAQAHI